MQLILRVRKAVLGYRERGWRFSLPSASPAGGETSGDIFYRKIYTTMSSLLNQRLIQICTMKKVTVILLLLLVEDAMPQIPNVYEFCSALMNNNQGQGGCQERCPPGLQGKRGPAGMRGYPGPKGDRGPEGSCDTLSKSVETTTRRVQDLKDAIFDFVTGSMENLVQFCGLGMKSGVIPNSAISESSSWDNNWKGFKGRLDSTTNLWVTRTNEVGHWIQIDLGEPRAVAGVITQGRRDFAQWVTSFKLAFRNDTSSAELSSEVFQGNRDRTTKVLNMLPNPIISRYVRLYVMSWNGQISMRMELVGGNCAGILRTQE